MSAAGLLCPYLVLYKYEIRQSAGGSASNFWCILLGGDINLSITMTFIRDGCGQNGKKRICFFSSSFSALRTSKYTCIVKIFELCKGNPIDRFVQHRRRAGHDAAVGVPHGAAPHRGRPQDPLRQPRLHARHVSSAFTSVNSEKSHKCTFLVIIDQQDRD